MPKLLFSSLKLILTQLDPHAFESLSHYQDKTIHITILNHGEFVLKINKGELFLSAPASNETNDHYDCYIQGALSNYLDLIFKYKTWIPGKGLTISGQSGIAQALFSCFKNLDPDFEQVLEKFFPHSIVALLSQVCERGAYDLKVWRDTRKKDLNIYLIDETHLLPSRYAMMRFEDDVLALNQACDALKKKVEGLQKNTLSLL